MSSIQLRDKPRSYRKKRQQGYVVKKWLLQDYGGHTAIREPEPPRIEAEPLAPLIQELVKQFTSSTAPIPDGREARFFRSNGLVARLVWSLRASANAQPTVETALDDLFDDLRAGEFFQHTGSVMALLYAMKRADSSFFDDVVAPFRTSGASEIGQIRRFVNQLVR